MHEAAAVAVALTASNMCYGVLLLECIRYASAVDWC